MYLLVICCLVAMLSGSATIGVVLFVYRQRKKRVVLAFAGFLSSLFLFLASMATYALGVAVGRSDSLTVTIVGISFLVLAGLSYVGIAPVFYHELVSRPVLPWQRGIYIALLAAELISSVVLFLVPRSRIPLLVLNTVLFATIGYGIVYIGVFSAVC